jgi:GNAT superfamily N-acetyltransferase
MSIVIRPYEPGDEVGIAYAHQRSILEICVKDYNHKQVAVWSKPCENPQRYVKSIENNGERFWVLDDAGTIAGFAGWHSDGIQGFYMHPDYAGKGLARRLFSAIEQEFWQLSGVDICRITSTKTARPFYEKMGFQVILPYVHTLNDRITQVDCWKMEKARP